MRRSNPRRSADKTAEQAGAQGENFKKREGAEIKFALRDGVHTAASFLFRLLYSMPATARL